MKRLIGLMISIFVGLSVSSLSSQQADDPYLWLEEVEGEKALEWVKAKNSATVAELQKHPEFQNINKRILDVLNSRKRIPYPDLYGDYVYNFWQDEKNPRGLWRRTLFSDYFKTAPEWETVLDLDALSLKEGENWAFKGASLLYPGYDLCLVRLSRGGSDAVEMREFDLVNKSFVEHGFFLAKAKGNASWMDKNTVLVATDFGPGTMTASGYPRITKIWHRGTPLSGARTLYSGQEQDMGVWGAVDNKPERQYIILSRRMTFYTGQVFILENDKLIKLDIPDDAQFNGFFKNQLLVELKSDWSVAGTTYRQGSLLSIDYDKFLMGDRSFAVVFKPDERSSLVAAITTKNLLLLNKLTNVKSELFQYSLQDGNWIGEKVKAPELGTVSVAATDDLSDHYFFNYTNYLTPTTLYYVTADGKRIEKAKSLASFFDAGKLQVEQFETASKDGTRIPYFIVYGKNAKPNGSHPTLLYGYGGFEAAMLPNYSATLGVAWLEKGGVYVVANIQTHPAIRALD